MWAMKIRATMSDGRFVENQEAGVAKAESPTFQYFKYANRIRSRYGLRSRSGTAGTERTQVNVSVDTSARESAALSRVDVPEPLHINQTCKEYGGNLTDDLRTRIAAVVNVHTSLVLHYSHATPTIACECFGWQGQSGDEGEHDLHVADAVIAELERR